MSRTEHTDPPVVAVSVGEVPRVSILVGPELRRLLPREALLLAEELIHASRTVMSFGESA